MAGLSGVFVGLDEYLGNRWADVLPQFPAPPGMDGVWIEPFELAATETELSITSRLLFDTPLALSLPGLDAVAVVLAPSGGGTLVPFALRISPTVELRIGVPIALRLDARLLRPVRRVPPAEPGQPDRFEPDPSVEHVDITLAETTLTIDVDGNVDLDVQSRLDLPPCMVGETGVVIEASDIRLHLRGDSPPAGKPPGWRGISLARAALYLPDAFPSSIGSLEVLDAVIGNGGFSGRVRSTWAPGLAVRFLGIESTLESATLDFVQNVPVASRISGTLTLPFFDQPVGVDLGLAINGDFTATLSAAQPPGVTRTGDGLVEFEKPGLLRLRLDSLGFEKRGGELLVKLSGRIKLLYGGFDWPEVDVRELSIDKDGNVRIDGGWLELPRSASLDFGGFAMELTKIGFGRSDGWNWIGFSGAMRLVDELALGASVEGLKVLWDTEGHVDLRMSALRVELEIPDVLAFDGFVEYFQDGLTKGFRGDVGLVLYPLETAFDASLMVGRNQESPPYNFFYVFVDAALPAGIPLAQTNLAIYGFSGLFGQNVAPNRTPQQEWFAWYLNPAPPGVTASNRWAPARGGQAFGAGITLGTATDNGFAFAAKTVFVLLLPGPLLIIDGQGNLLEDRDALAGAKQGQYRALAVLDRRAGTFLVNVQPTFKYDPMTAAVIEVTGLAEGFFDFNRPEAWHIYLGQAEPREKRIRARILKGLIKADAYLMLDRTGMRLGAGAGFEKAYDFGALSVDLRARIEGQADVSWRPVQVDGSLSYLALAELRAFGFSSSVSVNAELAVQTPQPFHVSGSFRVRLRTPWPLPDPSARIRLEWGSGEGDPPAVDTVASLAAEHLKTNDVWSLDRQPHRLKPPDVPPGLPVVPLDAKVLISFARPVADAVLAGCNAPAPPSPERVGPVEVLHELTDLRLARADGVWMPVERAGPDGTLFGMWLPMAGGDTAAGKLRLWTRSPFSDGRGGGRSHADWFLDRYPDYPCPPAEEAERTCVDFTGVKSRLLPALFVVGDLIVEFLFARAATRPRMGTVAAGPVLVLTYTDDPVPLRITPAVPAAAVEVQVVADGRLVLSAYRDGTVVAAADRDVAGEATLAVDARGIEWVELDVPRPTAARRVHVVRVCVVSQRDRDRADEVDRARHHVKGQLQPATARWCGEGHLLEPDALYELTVTTRERRWRDGDETTGPDRSAFVYFRTAGPPGFFPTTGRLRDLASYVDTGASTPGDGADPVYRGYDLRVVFNENYVERLYEGTGRPLRAVLRDRNGRQAGDEPTTTWLRHPGAEPPRSDRLWSAVLHRDPCEAAVDIDCVAPPSVLEARLADRPLAPRQWIELALLAAEDQTPLHRVRFTTSRFVTFVNHVQSFLDAAWDHHRIAGEPAAPLLTAEELDTVGAIVRAKRDASPDFDEGAGFETLRTGLFKLGPRPLPDRFEITALRDGERGYGLLLESPESLDRARASVAARLRPEAVPLGPSGAGAVKIIGASLPEPGSDDEWVDLLLLVDASPSGVAIERSGGTADAGEFISYHRFVDEAIRPAGTVIRLHAGPAPAATEPAPERIDRYLSLPPERRLNAEGDTLRLLDADGREAQRSTVVPAAAFQDLPLVTVRSADGTAAFLFFPESADVPVGPLPAGRVRLDWQFQRDIGSGAPVLTRLGRNEAEATAIEFDLPPRLP